MFILLLPFRFSESFIMKSLHRCKLKPLKGHELVQESKLFWLSINSFFLEEQLKATL